MQNEFEVLNRHLASESIIEGMPVTLMALFWLYISTEPCQLVTCDAAAIATAFPPYVHTLPPSERALSAAEVTALQGSRCTVLPVTSDQWLTIEFQHGSVVNRVPHRESAFFERDIEFSIPGAKQCVAQGRRACPSCRTPPFVTRSLAKQLHARLYGTGAMHAGIVSTNGTALTSDDFSCAGWSVPDAQHWLGFFQTPPFRQAWIAILSAFLGMLSSAYHLTRTYTYTTDPSASLWALPQVSLGPSTAGETSHASTLEDTCPDAADGGDALTLRLPAPEHEGCAVAEGSEVHPLPGMHVEAGEPMQGMPQHRGTASRPGGCVTWPDDSADRGTGAVRAAEASDRSARRSWVGTSLEVPPELGATLLYCVVVYLCFAADVLFFVHLGWQLVYNALLAAPHLSLIGAAFVAVLSAGCAKACVVAGVSSWRRWAAAFGQVRAPVFRSDRKPSCASCWRLCASCQGSLPLICRHNCATRARAAAVSPCLRRAPYASLRPCLLHHGCACADALHRGAGASDVDLRAACCATLGSLRRARGGCRVQRRAASGRHGDGRVAGACGRLRLAQLVAAHLRSVAAARGARGARGRRVCGAAPRGRRAAPREWHGEREVVGSS